MTGPGELEGKVAVVTGSSRGIGNALARGLAERGARVVIHGLDKQNVSLAHAALAQEFGEAQVTSCTFDVTDQADVRNGIAWIEKEVGPISILVNNAGIQHREALLQVALDDWDRVLRTNLTSAFLVGRQVAGEMIERRAGKIINIASIQADLGRASIAPYTASKGGLRNLTRAMAAEWARFGVQVNAIAPGYIVTDMTRSLVADQDFNAWVLNRTPAGRWGHPQDLIGTLAWLSSSGSDFVNGQTIFVDGGMSVVV